MSKLSRQVLDSYNGDSTSVLPELLVQAADDLMGGVAPSILAELRATAAAQPSKAKAAAVIGLAARLIASVGVNAEAADRIFRTMISIWQVDPQLHMEHFTPLLDVAAGHRGRLIALFQTDGEAGYPGTLVTACTYRLNGATLRIELSASADRATPVNLCHHSYFNLDGSGTILDHDLELAADFYTPSDSDWVPTGEILAVAHTPFDFRSARPIRLMDDAGERVRYDHNYVLRRSRLEPSGIAHLPLAHAATLSSRKSGLAMEVWTTEPGVQAYDGFKVNLPVPGHDGATYGPNAGLCLEPQHFPDSPNLAHFPSTILRPGETYRQVTEYRFG